MNNILITSAGQRVSLVRAFQEEVKKLDSAIKVYTTDLNPILSPACHISDGYFKVDRVTDPSYINQLLQICLERDVKLIIPTIDTELLILSQHKDFFIERGITPIVSEIDFVEKCRDKRIINQFFESHDIEIPQQIDRNSLSYPFYIKPYDGSLSKDTFLIQKESDLTDYHLDNPKLMFMEYIDHNMHDEYTVDTYYDKNGHLKCVVPRHRVFVRAGEINKGVTRKNILVEYIVKRLSYIKGAVGCLTMQYFMNPTNGRIIGIEINPRFGGGYPLSYLAGANFPQYILREHLMDESIAYFDGWEENLLMLRYDDEILVKNYEG